MIINQSNLNFLNTGFKASFQKGFAGVAPMWGRVATLVPSTTSKEAYAWLGQFPKLREWIGDRQIKNLVEKGYELANKKFEATVAVSVDTIKDDQYGVYSTLMTSYGEAAATHPDELVFETAVLGGATALCFDGQPFFDADHPVGMPGYQTTVSNVGGGTGPRWYLLDTTRALKPFIFQEREKPEFVVKFNPNNSDHVFLADEFLYGIKSRCAAGYGFWQLAFMSQQPVSAEAVEAAYTSMTTLVSDEGRKLGIKPNIILCGPSTYFAFRALIEAQIINATSNTLYKLVDIVLCPYLD